MNIFEELKFSPKWLDLGIINLNKLKEFEVDWLAGQDTSTEHYRWRAFKVDMSEQAILRRLQTVDQLREVCLLLMKAKKVSNIRVEKNRPTVKKVNAQD